MFTDGQLVNARHLNEMIKFGRKITNLMKAYVTGTGIVIGLDIISVTQKGSEWYATIEQGMAFAPDGREMIVDGAEIPIQTNGYDPIAFLGTSSPSDLGLYLKPKSLEGPPTMPLYGTSTSCDETCVSEYQTEGYEAYFDLVKKDLTDIELNDLQNLNYSFSSLRELANDYYVKYLKSAPQANPPEGILLAVLGKTSVSNVLSVDQAKTKKYRKPVYNNSLLYNLMIGHIDKTKTMVTSVNDLDGELHLISNAFDVLTNRADNKNIISIEPKQSYYQIFSGKIHLTYQKDAEQIQDFGPVFLNLNLQNIPAVILAKADDPFTRLDFSQYLRTNPSDVLFAPVNVSNNSFNIRITKQPNSNGATLKLMYFVIAASNVSDETTIFKIGSQLPPDPNFTVTTTRLDHRNVFADESSTLTIHLNPTPNIVERINVIGTFTHKTGPRVLTPVPAATVAATILPTHVPAPTVLTPSAPVIRTIVMGGIPVTLIARDRTISGIITRSKSANAPLDETLSIRQIITQLAQSLPSEGGWEWLNSYELARLEMSYLSPDGRTLSPHTFTKE